MKKTALMIAGFVLLVVASFVWFVATWDPAKEEPVVGHFGERQLV